MLPTVLPQKSRSDTMSCSKWIDNYSGKGGVQEIGQHDELKDELCMF